VYSITDAADIIAGLGTLDITPLNDAPQTTPVVLSSVAEDSGVRIITQAELLSNASDADNDSLTVTGLTADSGSLTDNADGTWNYIPAANANGTVNFNYNITDSTNNTAGTATLEITPVNDAPIAMSVVLSPIAEDSGVRLITQAELLANTTDTEGDSRSLFDNGDGTWNYTPADNDDTDVSFEYTVTDGVNNTVGSAILDITSVNDAPSGTDGEFHVAEDTDYIFSQDNFGFSDSIDTDDQLSAVRIDVLPTAGTLLLSGTAIEAGDIIPVNLIDTDQLIYIPGADRFGTDDTNRSGQRCTGRFEQYSDCGRRLRLCIFQYRLRIF